MLYDSSPQKEVVCPNCGKVVPPTKRCPNCGNYLPRKKRFDFEKLTVGEILLLILGAIMLGIGFVAL
ncbi:large ribosomal subunit protein bL32 [Pontibacter harenae]|uniref:large ribosomal subunit protein bL32 n=1 Tax=Pontibacter harenae TaxID=2894083 RepID=UPI001E3DC7EC|nr:zinc ribbon domain-containing protein [Pontibacter harenae]MCC9165346.1 hypothetical protein [Pontibacter harenae]